MKKVLILSMLLLAGCGKSASLNKILYGGTTGDAPKAASDYPMRTVACCKPVGPSTAAYCARLLGPEGTHVTYGSIEHWIVEDGYFNFPLQSVCDTAMVK